MPTLDWLNRAQTLTTAARVPYRLLEEVSAHTAVIRLGPGRAGRGACARTGRQRYIGNARPPAAPDGIDMAAQIRAAIQG